MKQRVGTQPLGIGGRWVCLALASALVLCGGTPAVIAQVGTQESTDIVGQDYFMRSVDPRVAATVRTVETHHLSDNNFWRTYREGAFEFALNDLLFILRYIPNHPKALYLIAFDTNLNKDTSLSIQLFERAIRLFPRSAYTYAQYGHFLTSLGQESAGIEFLDEALSIDPDLIIARAWREEAQVDRPRAEQPPSGGKATDKKAATSTEKTSQGK